MKIEFPRLNAGNVSGREQCRKVGAAVGVVHVEDEPLAIGSDHVYFPLGMLLLECQRRIERN